MFTHPSRARSRCSPLIGALLLLAACGDDDKAETSSSPVGGAGAPGGAVDAGVAATAPDASGAPGAAETSLYLATSWVTNNDETSTYISLIDAVDTEQTLDFAQALEVGGYGDAWVHEGKIFVADGEAPIVTRYKVVDGKLAADGVVSFANYGLKSAAFYDHEILSATKAYVVNAQSRQYIAWDPSTMTILKEVPWPAITFPAGWEPFHSYTDRGGVVVGKYFFHAIYQHEGEDFVKFGDASIVGVYDIETDQLVKTIDVPCPMMDVMSLADDGKLYLSAWTYIPLSVTAGRTPKNCAARIDVATQSLDTSWTVDMTALTGGKQGSGLRVVSGTEAIFAVFHGTGIAVTPTIDIWDLDEGENDWELYSLDLATRAAKPTGIKFGDGSYYESHVGDRYFVYLPGDTDTQVYERTASGYVPKFKARGWMSRLFKVR